MDKQSAQAFRNRWKAVEMVETEEQRAASIAQRWRQLNAIFRLAAGLGLPATEQDDDEIVYRRWAKLKGGQG